MDGMAAVRLIGCEVTVFCLCGATAGGWDYGGVPGWAKVFMAAHPEGVDGHGPATEEQAAAARRARSQTTWPIDACEHAWQMNLANDHVCVREGGCGLRLVTWPPDRPLPARGVDWAQAVLVTPGRLLFRRPA